MTDNFVPEEWVYAGQRADRKCKPFHVFSDPNGKELWYDKAPSGSAIGGVYEVQVDRTTDPEAVTAKIRAARFLRRSDDERRAGWELEHRAAMNRIEAKRAERRLKVDGMETLGDLTLAEFRKSYQSSHMPMHRAGALAALLAYLDYETK